jgi:hypothetical protein
MRTACSLACSAVRRSRWRLSKHVQPESVSS